MLPLMTKQFKNTLALSLFALLGFLTLTKPGRDLAKRIGVSFMMVSQRGIKFIAQKEGFSATPYPDAGGYSIGYGHFILPGERFTSITKAQAEALLTADVMKANDAIARLVKVPLTQNQHDALVSFIYNVGVGNFSGSTLLKKLNARDFVGAANEFGRWNKSRGTVLPALVMRREDEREVFLT